MSAPRPLKIGILVGSARRNGNHIGLTRWITQHLAATLEAQGLGDESNIEVYGPTTAPNPLGPILSERTPFSRTGTAQDGFVSYGYDETSTREWSLIVQRLSGIVVLTPQWNGMFPGDLKNMIDHLYWEWQDLPVALVGYGISAGARSTAALRVAFGVALSSKLIGDEDVNIPLPMPDYVQGSARVKGDDEFLSKHIESLKEKLAALVQAATERVKEPTDIPRVRKQK